MPPTLEDRFIDILAAIDDVEALTAEVSKEQLAVDKFRRLALERSLEILCEASRHIPEAIKAQADIRWRDIVDLGNLLRHAYHRVDPDTLWYIARNDLPPLKGAIKRLLAKME